MRARLTITADDRPLRRCLLHSGQAFEVGRGRSVDVQLSGRGVSRRHVLLELGDDGLLVHDLGSRNGTDVDGVPVTSGGPPALISGQGSIRVGGYDIQVIVTMEPGQREAAARRAQTQSLLAPYGLDLRYEIGRGATGSVWAAWQSATERMVAVKLLEGIDPEDRQRFIREGQVCSRLDHPNIVKLFDLKVERGKPFLVMELVPGLSALERLSEGPIPLGEVLGIGADVASALVQLAEDGVIHRDIKPGNILLAPSGKARLTDFGIAKDLSAATLTQSGTGLGTFSYVAPEQFQEARDVTPSADLYALGATLYHLIAGRPPFVFSNRGNPAEFVHRILNEDPPHLKDVAPDCPPEVASLVHAMLAKSPGRRPRTAQVAYSALQELRRHYQRPEHESDPNASTWESERPTDETASSD